MSLVLLLNKISSEYPPILVALNAIEPVPKAIRCYGLVRENELRLLSEIDLDCY